MRPIIYKRPRYVNAKLLSLARTMPCMFTFAHDCRGDVMACHANWQQWGKGVGLKCPDWAWAAGCMAAHREIDGKIGATMTREERESHWLNAFIATQDFLWSEGRVRVA